MNINFELSFNSGLRDTSGNEISLSGLLSEDILLTPFYATENDVLLILMEEPTIAYEHKVRELIFNNSIIIDDKLLGIIDIPEDQLFRLKRQYVMCLSIYQFCKIFYQDYMKSVKKTKFLGDVKVSLDVEHDPSFIMQMANDAKECFEEIEDILMITSGGTMSSFVKGRGNSCNYVSNRQWYPKIRGSNPRVPIAASKVGSFCVKYKIGIA